MKDIVIAGIQGCGKGTQGSRLLKQFPQIKCFEAGGILRALQSRPNAIGEYVTSIINTGDLLKDEIMVKLFETFLETLQEGDVIMCDGFPRQVKQARLFMEAMKHAGRELQVIILDVSEETAKKRLSGRRICTACGGTFHQEAHQLESRGNLCPDCNSALYQREDDKDMSSIETRIRLFYENTLPVLEQFEAMGVVKHINGEQSIEQVFADVLAACGE